MASRANSFYRCPSNNEAANSFAFPVNEVLSARMHRPTTAQHHSRGAYDRATSPLSKRIAIPVFPRAFSEVITHEQLIPAVPHQASFQFHMPMSRRLRGHSPEVRPRNPEAVKTRTVSMSPLPRAFSAVTWCNSHHLDSQPRPLNPTLLTSSPQRENADAVKSSRVRPTFPQAPRAVVVQSRKMQASGSRHAAGPALKSSPRPQRIIASPRATANASATGTFSSLVGCGAPERKAPPPINMPLSVRAQASTSHGYSTAMERTPVQEPPEFSLPSTDVESLLKYLRELDEQGLRLTEVVYCINNWMLYGLIPLRHHGLILYSEGSRSCGKDPYLTLDFGNRGILWDTFENYPDVPEGTFFAKTYKIDLDPMILREYCKAAQPFSWPDNDCKNFAHGALLLMGIADDPCPDSGALDRFARRGHKGLREIITCGAGHNSNRAVGCMQ